MLGAHRMAWECTNGAVPEGLVVCHSCDVRACINLDHLFLGTQADNVADMFKKGRARDNVGRANPRAKLTDQDILAIRASALNQRAIARLYGVSQKLISDVKLRKSWRHLP